MHTRGSSSVVALRRFVNTQQAARVLRCSPATVVRLAAAGALPGAKLARDGWRIPPAALEVQRRRKAACSSTSRAPRYTTTCYLPFCDEPARGTGGCLCDPHERFRTRCLARGEEPVYRPVEKTEPPAERVITVYGEYAESETDEDFRRNKERLMRSLETWMKSRGWMPPTAKCPLTKRRCLAAPSAA